LAVSDSLWKRRISIVATQYFIRNGHFTPTSYIADMLREDREDLIHKAVGRMLREVGNRDLEAETEFLRRRYTKMPRTMLR
jgi:3-methyladenine DNA glycosylase AlkD